MNKKTVNIGSRDYQYMINDNKEEIFTKKEKINGKEIDIIIKNGNEENNKTINEHIIKVLGDLYVERKLKELNKHN